MQATPIHPERTECATYGLIHSQDGEGQRLHLEAQLGKDLLRALQLGQNILWHNATGPSHQSAAEFVLESGPVQADQFFIQFVAHLARPAESPAIQVSLACRWMVTAAARAVQLLADAAQDGKRFTFEARQ